MAKEPMSPTKWCRLFHKGEWTLQFGNPDQRNCTAFKCDSLTIYCPKCKKRVIIDTDDPWMGD